MWTRYSRPISVNGTLVDDLRAAEIRVDPAANWNHLDRLGVLVMQRLRRDSRRSPGRRFDAGAGRVRGKIPQTPETTSEIPDQRCHPLVEGGGVRQLFTRIFPVILPTGLRCGGG